MRTTTQHGPRHTGLPHGPGVDRIASGKVFHFVPALFFLALLEGTAPAQSLTSVTLTPTTVAAGKPSSGQVSLSAAAPSGGATVTLSSSHPAVALIPASTLVQAGSTTGSFTVTTELVATTTAVTITATRGGVQKTATLTVEPSPPLSLVAGGFPLIGATYTSSDWDPGQNVWTDVTGDALLSLVADGTPHAIFLHFEDVTIAPNAQGTGTVTEGSAIYTPPGDPPVPKSLVLAGLTLLLDGLVIEQSGAMADGRLQLPASLIDATSEECGPAILDLGTFPITKDCRFYVSRPAGTFGPWTLAAHDVQLSGSNFEADFSLTQSPILTPAVPPDFRGVVLRLGSTVPAAGPIISNTGYLKGNYSFTDAVVTSPGLKAVLSVAAPFDFFSLEPWGYRITVPAGHLNVVDSTVTGGLLANDGVNFGLVRFPGKAVVYTSTGTAVTAFYSSIEVQSDLDLYGEVYLSGGADITWGELGDSGNPLRFYDAGPLEMGRFYLSAVQRPAYFPILSDAFKKLTPSKASIEAQGIQGVTFSVADSDPTEVTFVVRTPDTPSQQTIVLDQVAAESWVHIGARGVHAEIFSRRGDSQGPLDLALGPNHLQSYAPGQGSPPFNVTIEKVSSQGFDHQYFWLFQFVESAVFHSDMNGKVHLPFPASADLPFSNMRFTSTAHDTGAKVALSGPVEMSHWGLDLVPKQIGATSAVMSVKTGQIFLTAAGIAEPRHFSLPFFLLWGELFASGHVGSFVFDHNVSGQTFDGFPFTPEIVALSEAIPADPVLPYLHVAGTAHFDFFGEHYLDIRDYRDDDNPGPPHDGRRIELQDGGEHGAGPTDFAAARKWDGDFGSVHFTIMHDETDQDGFVSDPQAVDSNRLEVIYFKLPVAASLDLSSKRTCLTIHEESNRRVSLPFLLDFADVKRITGCGCIEDGVLKQLVLSSELATDVAGGILHKGAYLGVEKVFTPATSEFSMNGMTFLNTGGGDVQVVGRVHFLVDRENDFFDGEIQGQIDTSTFLGIAGGLTAEGQLGWHLGSLDNGGYELLQGMVAVNVMAPAGALGVGVEGGFLVGVNAPKEKAWVIIGTDPRFDGSIDLLPDYLSGVFGYAKVSSSVNAFILQGGFDAYLGVGAFLEDEAPLPGVFGRMYANIWGEFLGGLVSASAWLDSQLFLGIPPRFQGTAGLEVCAVWVICETAEVTLTLDEDGFELSN